MTIKQEYRKFLDENFKGLRLRPPLFYSWYFGIRFNLQTGETFNSSRQILDSDGNIIPMIGDNDSEEYFYNSVERAAKIFNTIFRNSDQVFLVYMNYKFRKRKIRNSNFLFRQINNIHRNEVFFSKEKQLYNPNDKFDIRNIAIIKLTADRINYHSIFEAISNMDFPFRQPRLDNKGFLSSKEVYFINIDKKIVFSMYDDRGVDIISSEKETLRPIYIKHNDWILDYDRKEIDKQFE